MEKKNETQPKQTKQTAHTVRFRFICEKLVHFGQAVFVSGSVAQMGAWKPENALRMTCYDIQQWVVDVEIPVETQIEFKYFVSPEDNISPSYWIGSEVDDNLKLLITKQEAKQISYSRKTRELKTMSFNIRNDKAGDKNEFAWETRKQNCVRAIREHFPSLIGIQECTTSQRGYLEKSLEPYYKYVGLSEMNQAQQEVGIFYDRQRFILVECGFRFMCGAKKNVEKSSGSTCPSMFSFAILQDTYNSERFINAVHPSSSKSQLPRELFMLENVYLSYHATKSQQECLEMIVGEITAKREQYQEELRDVFVIGDFNLPENSHLMHGLEKADVKLESVRKNLLKRHLKEHCDLGHTFEAFAHDQHDVENPKKIIDHVYLASKDYEPTRFQVIRELTQKAKPAKQQVISDHFPIMGVFRHKRSHSSAQKVVV